ncbi:MAG: PQQ-binding-like beta-propeller repeat protein [Fimbriimonadaceae bacterium]|nr:PQQ-binding-like beta-propeller repeat protein [Fimbriimonadaceae bacterium]
MTVRRLWWTGVILFAVANGQADDFTMARYNAARTGSTPEKLAPPLALQWQFATDKDTSFVAAPLVIGNRVYFCSLGTVYCLDAETGETKWEYQIRYDIRNTPLYDRGRLYVGTAKGELHVIDVSDDTTPKVVTVLDLHKGLTSDPLILGDTLYLANDAGRVLTFNLQTWAEAELLRLPDAPKGPLATDGKSLYVTSTNGMLTTYEFRRKRVVWSKSTGILSTAPIAQPGGAVVGSRDEIQRLRDITGTQEWRRPGAGVDRGGLALGNNRIFAAGRDEFFLLVDAVRGNLLARVEADAPLDRPGTIADTDCYIGTGSGNIFCLDGNNLEVKWLYRCNPVETVGKKVPQYKVATAPVIANGSLLVATTQGSLYCFRADAVDVGKPKLYLPQISTNAVDGSLVAMPVNDDELRDALLEEAKANAKEGEEPEVPKDAEPLKLPGKQRTFRFETYVYDEGSGVDLSKIVVKWDDKPWLTELIKVVRNDYLLTVDLVSQREGAARARLDDGDHVLSITVPDYRGNLIERKYSLTIDNSLPPLPPKKPDPPAGGGPGGPGAPGGVPGAPVGPSGSGAGAAGPPPGT